MNAARVAWDPRCALTATLLCGCGAVIASSGLASDQIVPAVAGAAALALGLTVILLAGWIDVLLVLVAALPLPAFYSTASARVAPALLVTLLVAFALFVSASAERRVLQFENAPFGILGVMVFALLAATAFSEQRATGLRELSNWGILFSLLVLVTAELTGAPERQRQLARIIAGVMGLSGAAALLQAVGVLPSPFVRAGTNLSRATLGFGWPNEGGMFLAIGLPFTVHAWSTADTPTRRRWAFVALAGTVMGLASTFSRGSWLSVLAAPAILLFAGQRRFVLRIWLAALVAGLLVDLLSGGAIRDRVADTIGDWVIEQRLALTFAGILMFIANPYVGVGPGNFGASLQEYGPFVSWLYDYQPTAQNAYVQMAAEAGVIGLLGLLVFIGFTLRVLLQDARRLRADPLADPLESSLQRTLLWSFTTACLLGFVEWPFAHGIGELIMLVAALAFARSRTAAPR
jgi:O-antigen ligase